MVLKRYLPLLLLILLPILAKAQLTRKNVSVDGTLRTYFVHLPNGSASTPDLPLVINLHGFGSNATEQAAYSRFNSLADLNDFIVVYPEGLVASLPELGDGQHWNSGFQTGVADVQFMNDIIDIMWNEYAIDLSRVYVTGMSNGGFMAYTLACELGDRVAAISSVTGSMLNLSIANCDPERPIPVLQFHGTEDQIVPYEGSDIIAPVEQVVSYWAQNNGCADEPVVSEIMDSNTSDNSTVTRSLYNDCPDGLQVDFYRIVGGGHTWPGALIEQPQLGETNRDISASSLSWSFFERFVHPNPREPRIITSTDTEILPDVSVFPTSIDSHLYLRSETPAEITLMNTMGLVVMHYTVAAGEHRLATTNLPGGIYILSIRTAQGQTAQFKLFK